MDNLTGGDSSDKESSDRKNSNSEWLPTKCRITKPPPPKPASNPLQFVKVVPSSLFQKAHEQIKKVEEIKTQRSAIKEDAEEWQQNLDNWKSSRRKMQEHIIERVVEVKKFEQDGYDKNRRKSKTFNEMLEDRSKRGHRLNIPIFDDDANDLSDYGIGSASSKANSVKDVDTDDSSSCLDEKEPCISTSDSARDISSASNQSQSEDELLSSTKNLIEKENNAKNNVYNKMDNNYSTPNSNKEKTAKPTFEVSNVKQEEDKTDYTYQKAIEDYRSRILPKLESENIFTEFATPKVETYSPKQKPELKKVIEITPLDLNTSKRLAEDFANSLSIKERLKSLEKCADLPLKSVEKNTKGHSVKSIIKSFSKPEDKNNHAVPTLKGKDVSETVSLYLEGISNQVPERTESPEVDAYLDKLHAFSQDLDSYMTKTCTAHGECSEPTMSTLSSSSLDQSDRGDSGIHTADVSCSVSQADESVEFNDMLSSTIPNCIEKLQKERERELSQQIETQFRKKDDSVGVLQNPYNLVDDSSNNILTPTDIEKTATSGFKQDSSINNLKHTNDGNFLLQQESLLVDIHEPKSSIAIYENVEMQDAPNFFGNAFPLAPPKTKEPPREKPPPPPLEDDEKNSIVKRLNSTKRIKKEMNIKRSSFLGLSEPSDDITDVMPTDTLQDISILCRKYPDGRETCASEVESQDSGLESERGRLSSDTWCSSIGETISTHDRQDSGQTNTSVTSEEDDIAKKEQEIIALVEREEKSKEFSLLPNHQATSLACCTVKTEHFKIPYFPKKNSNYNSAIVEQDSEVLKVQHELLLLEKEELHRKNENIVFRENREKLLRKSRYSLENICDTPDTFSGYCNDLTCRTSMPDLPDCDNYYNNQNMDTIGAQYYKSGIDAHHRKSMPDIQQACFKSVDLHDIHKQLYLPIEHGKSMPELQKPALPSRPPPINRQPVMPGKPLTALIKEQRDKDKLFMKNSHQEPNKLQYQIIKPISRPGLNALSAVPKHRNISNDNWIQPKIPDSSKPKSYNKHWLYQEAELRRLTEQNSNPRIWNLSKTKPEKHIPEPIIQSLTQRVQNLPNERTRQKRSDNNLNLETTQPTYINRPQAVDHASAICHPLENSEGKVLSVSGKKKCSFCGNELGRGAAMIIESLCLFYHLDCFKCCVCHIQLGDGLIGTDVRVRNQKLHCHNCYTTDDGVKFSCV